MVFFRNEGRNSPQTNKENIPMDPNLQGAPQGTDSSGKKIDDSIPLTAAADPADDGSNGGAGAPAQTS